MFEIDQDESEFSIHQGKGQRFEHEASYSNYSEGYKSPISGRSLIIPFVILISTIGAATYFPLLFSKITSDVQADKAAMNDLQSNKNQNHDVGNALNANDHLVNPLSENELNRTYEIQDQKPFVAQFPVNGAVVWGDRGQPLGEYLAQFEIWDVTSLPQNKIVRIRNDRGEIYATVYMRRGQRVTLMLPGDAYYYVTATSGNYWQNDGTGFGERSTSITFGGVLLQYDAPAIIAIGAEDQPLKYIPNSKF